MKLLAIEASSHEASCALLLDEAILERRVDPALPSSATLLPAIQRLMAEAGLSFGDLDGIVFGAGPGAFTGVRVAVGITQGLAFAHTLPVAGIETLAALAFAAQQADASSQTDGAPKEVLATLDARMNEIYHARYCMNGDQLIRLDEIRVSGAAAVQLPPEGTPWILCGNAAAAYPAFAARVSGARSVADVTLPRAADIAALGRQAFLRGETGPAESALPLYVRNKVAQTIAERLAVGGRA